MNSEDRRDKDAGEKRGREIPISPLDAAKAGIVVALLWVIRELLGMLKMLVDKLTGG